ncbi:MAG: HEPN domain-containing protein [Pseudomonadota bacterium]
MSASENDIIHKVLQWIAFGDEDLEFAKHGLTLASIAPYRLIAYHAQQCAEKYLKAYLVYHRIDFPYTHNIARLLELCPDRHGWDKDIEEAEELTPFAITTRYPGEDEPVTESEAKRAIDIAEGVRKIISSFLLKKGLNYQA